MKKKLLPILLILSLVMAMLPSLALADSEYSLELAIKTVKTLFEIPESYSKFDYNANSIGERKIWYLHWSKKDDQGYNISVAVDDRGSIRNYTNYAPYQYEQRRLPKFGREEALETAKNFIEHVNPRLLQQLKLMESNRGDTGTPYYSFEFIRLEGGIQYPANQIRITVNNETGRVENYNYNWSDKVVFPPSDKKITSEAAKAAYRAKLGIRLTYQSTFEDDKIKIFPVYAPAFEQMYVIDAITGDKVNLGNVYRTYGGGGAYDMKSEKAMLASKRNGPELTEEELKAIDKVSKLLTINEADSRIRNTEVIGLDSGYTLERSNLSRDWPSREDFVWDLSYIKGTRTGKSNPESAYVRLDAKTGSIKSFYIFRPDQDTGEAKMDEKRSREAVEKFLKEFRPDLFSQITYEDNGMGFINPAEKMPRHFSFRYTRVVNGIPFQGNTVTVGLNSVTGKVTEFSSVWYIMEFPALDKVIPLDKAYDTLFEKIGLGLEYRPDYSNAENFKLLPERQDNPAAIRLVYALDPSRPLWIDAFSDTLLNYAGAPYKEVKAVEYTDIKGHYAEKKIQALAEFGITLQGTEFKPDENILQVDFFRLLLKSLNNYYMENGAGNEDKAIEEMYRNLVREGIVKEGENAQKSLLSREDAVKFLIRALKYGKVAEIKGIYQYPFIDVEQANPEWIGHITLAKGLGLVEGVDGYFYPKNNVTRAQAMVMLYNYLQR